MSVNKKRKVAIAKGKGGGKQNAQRLTEIDTFKVDLVDAGANKMSFAVVKSDQGAAVKSVLEAALALSECEKSEDAMKIAKDMIGVLKAFTGEKEDAQAGLTKAKEEGGDTEKPSSHWMAEMREFIASLRDAVSELREEKNTKDKEAKNDDFRNQVFKAAGFDSPQALARKMNEIDKALASFGEVAKALDTIGPKMKALFKRLDAIERSPVASNGGMNLEDIGGSSEDDAFPTGDLTKAAK